MKYAIIFIFILYTVLLLLVSCEGMNDNIEQYLNRGEINYIGKVDSASTVGGKERIRITWKVNDDPRIENCRIFWNSKQDSVVCPVDRNALDAGGYMSFTFHIPEGTYIFDMYHTGVKGYRSVREEATGTVYGAVYQSSLVSRATKEAYYDDGIIIVWGASVDATSIGTEITYKPVGAEQSRHCFLPATAPADTLKIDDYDVASGSITYRTAYLPEPASLDTFYSQPKEVQIKDVAGMLEENLRVLGVKAFWDFKDAGNLFKAVIGPDLIPVGSGFTQTVGYNKRTKAIVLPSSEKVEDVWHHNHLIYNHGFAANGGGSKVNEFTILIDCKFPGGPTSNGSAWTNGKYYSLYQTSLTNSADASFFWRPPANFGITGNYTTEDHLFVKDTWYRFVISAKLGSELKYFMNGRRCVAGSNGAIDSNRAWELDGVLLFADDDGENGQGFPLIVSSLAVFDRALTDAEIQTISTR